MRKLFFVSTLFFITVVSFAEKTDPVADLTISVEQIEKNLVNYEVDTIFSDSLSSQISYTDKKAQVEVVMVQLVDVASRTFKTVKWYFKAGELIHTEQKWVDFTSQNVVNLEKTFWWKRQLIQWTKTDGSTADPNSYSFLEFRNALLNYSDKLRHEF